MGAGNRSAMGTLAERTSRVLLLVRLDTHHAESVREAFEKKMMRLHAHLELSLTYDQRKAMSQHRLFTKETRIKVRSIVQPFGDQQSCNDLNKYPHSVALDS